MIEKINSSDLMIGNYLQKDGVIHQVIAISGSITDSKKGIKKAATIRTDKSSEYMFLDHFEPILVTIKILNKLNFNKIGNVYRHDEVLEYSVSQLSGCFYVLDSNEITECSHTVREVKYLHDLQNTFKINRKFVLKLKK